MENTYIPTLQPLMMSTGGVGNQQGILGGPTMFE